MTGATEIADGKDNDCDGAVDEGTNTGGPGNGGDNDFLPLTVDFVENLSAVCLVS